jgi:small subunit ribosomal protein S20
LAHHKSAIKRALTNEKSRLRNRAKKTALRNELKKLTSAKDDAKVVVSKEVCALVDHLARKKVIHKNKAARIKSRTQRALNTKAA